MRATLRLYFSSKIVLNSALYTLGIYIVLFYILYIRIYKKAIQIFKIFSYKPSPKVPKQWVTMHHQHMGSQRTPFCSTKWHPLCYLESRQEIIN